MMFRTLKLVAGLKQINEKSSSLFLLTTSNFVPVATIARNYKVRSERADKEVEFCRLGDIEELKHIEKDFTAKSSQNKICKFILKENIKVPNLIGFTRAKTPLSLIHLNLPEDVSLGRFTAVDDNVIRKNMDTLSNKTKVKSYGDILILDAKDKLFHAKMEIIGSFLSQGMQKVRLPQEVFFRARNLLVLSKGEFTENEKKIIKEHVSSCENFRDWQSLADKLNRAPNIVRSYAVNCLRYEDKSRRGRFSLDETKKIIKTVFQKNKNALANTDDPLYGTANIWNELAQDLNRPPKNVIDHWLFILQPLLTRYEAGVLEVDFKIPLLEYCIENDIQYPQNANWKEISRCPQFYGTTPLYLSYIYKNIRQNTKTSNKIRDNSITTVMMLEYQTSTGQKKRNNKEENDILDCYKNAIKKNNK